MAEVPRLWAGGNYTTVTQLRSVFQHSEGQGAAPLSMETGLWILQGPTRPSGLSSSITVLLGRKARGRACQLKALPPSLWMSM